jgi:hypothetical protein
VFEFTFIYYEITKNKVKHPRYLFLKSFWLIENLKISLTKSVLKENSGYFSTSTKSQFDIDLFFHWNISMAYKYNENIVRYLKTELRDSTEGLNNEKLSKLAQIL